MTPQVECCKFELSSKVKGFSSLEKPLENQVIKSRDKNKSKICSKNQLKNKLKIELKNKTEKRLKN